MARYHGGQRKQKCEEDRKLDAAKSLVWGYKTMTSSARIAKFSTATAVRTRRSNLQALYPSIDPFDPDFDLSLLDPLRAATVAVAEGAPPHMMPQREIKFSRVDRIQRLPASSSGKDAGTNIGGVARGSQSSKVKPPVAERFSKNECTQIRLVSSVTARSERRDEQTQPQSLSPERTKSDHQRSNEILRQMFVPLEETVVDRPTSGLNQRVVDSVGGVSTDCVDHYSRGQVAEQVVEASEIGANSTSQAGPDNLPDLVYSA